MNNNWNNYFYLLTDGFKSVCLYIHGEISTSNDISIKLQILYKTALLAFKLHYLGLDMFKLFTFVGITLTLAIVTLLIIRLYADNIREDLEQSTQIVARNNIVPELTNNLGWPSREEDRMIKDLVAVKIPRGSTVLILSRTGKSSPFIPRLRSYFYMVKDDHVGYTICTATDMYGSYPRIKDISIATLEVNDVARNGILVEYDGRTLEHKDTYIPIKPAFLRTHTFTSKQLPIDSLPSHPNRLIPLYEDGFVTDYDGNRKRIIINH